MSRYFRPKPGIFIPGNARFFDFALPRSHLLFLAGTFFLLTAGIGLPATREFTKWILAENSLVEMLTFVLFLVGAGIGLTYSLRLVKQKERWWVPGFYSTFSVGLFFIAMEEVSWGQQFFGFETPETFREINEQGETTIHNIRGMSGNTEYLRLIFGIGGMVGILLYTYESFRKVAAPVLLLPWFLVIIAHSIVDIFNDIVPIQKHFDALISELAEFVELLIAMAAVIFLWLKATGEKPSIDL